MILPPYAHLPLALRRSFTWFAALLTFVSAALAADRKPNLILILADDLGYETIGANGGSSYKTPVLDQLASTGARFEQCYAQPLCTPTRVQLMTGLSNARNYLNFGNMDPKAVTFANLLKPAGYATCMVGKWQLGQEVELPKKFGFDENCLWWHMRRADRYKNPGLEINGVSKDWNNNEYGPDLLNDYALDFIQRKKDVPFFLYYPMTLTHDPYEATPDTPNYSGADRKAGKKGGDETIRQRNFRDMVQYMDKLIGKLVARLDTLGLRENTLIIFVGDNGTGKGTRSMMGSKLVIGGKGTTTDAGMHVPLIVNWTGKIAAGKVSSDLVDTTDFLPTLLDAASVPLPAKMKIDGHSFWPQLRGERGEPRDWIYSWYSPRQNENNKAITEFVFNRDFKLYRTGEFYDLRTDRGEEHALKVTELKSEAATAAATLQRALDQFKGARPAHLEDGPSSAKKKRK